MLVVGAGAGCARDDEPGMLKAAPTGAWPQQTRVPGEYHVTVAAPAGVEAVSDVFGRFGIKAIRNIAPNLFLLTLSEDPGPDVMGTLGSRDARIRAVQPNFIYRTQEKP
jgi:hypothetical protein